ncbi:MAG: protein kinase [Rubrivivax sp.]|nr:MAG: protein kinase [Rubrivivax sp.]
MSTLARLRGGQLAGARRLDLNEGLEQFPREIFDLADTLEVLNLSGNRLSALPADLHRLRRLKVIFGSDNRFTSLPEVLGDCPALTTVGFKSNQIDEVPGCALPPRLRWLILTDNRVGRLPAVLGERPDLEKLMLAGNRLHKLPDSLQASHHLALLRIAANEFDSVPRWLADLPRLAWLGYGGNPCTMQAEAARLATPGIPRRPWATLALQEVLGEGASGLIHRAALAGESTPDVAVKLFKGRMTSDGLPASEMAAWLAAGSHDSIIPVRAVVADHPQGQPGIVMPLVDAEFMTLAGPPSMDSCSRDVYPAERRFTVGLAWRIARHLAQATAHLHARGILHGDLYAHNTLWRADGRSLLGDFGAASFLPAGDAAFSRALQGLEARAFGCLLQELSTRSEAATPDEIATLGAMHALQAQCLALLPGERPLFTHIAAALEACGDA